MALGVGVDIVLLSRMKEKLNNAGKVFLDKVFTSSEQQQAESHPNAIAYLAMTFAAKEAIFKTFGMGWNSGVQFTEIEITNGKYGEPIPVLRGRFAEVAIERGVTAIHISLSNDGDYAVAVAMLDG